MRRSILNRRKRLKIKKDFELPLTSMMDILIIILIFLLKSYTSTSVSFATSSKINLPISTTEDVPSDALHLIIEPTGIIFDNVKVVDFILPQGKNPNDLKPEDSTYEIDSTLLGDGGRKILPLYDAMIKAKENAELLMSKTKWVTPSNTSNAQNTVNKETTTPKFQGIITIQADKSVRYELLRKIMYTAGSAQYKVFKFIAIKKETSS
jgi:biopolymer transport protein ExbD